MGMFDEIDLGVFSQDFNCEYCGEPLTGWQTKDAECMLTLYQLRDDRVLCKSVYEPDNTDRLVHATPTPVPKDFCAVWLIYTSCSCWRRTEGRPFVCVHMQLVIMDGKLHRIKRVEQDC